jgi:hypothetical protein
MIQARDIKKRNNYRTRQSRARNFGPEADAVRAMECAVAVAAEQTGQPHIQLVEHGWAPCAGAGVCAHVDARAMGGRKGGRFDLVRLCAGHHDEAGERGKGCDSKRRKFDRKYGLDLRALADAVAVGHERPLGIRGLADRWAWWHEHAAVETVVDVHASFEDSPSRLEGYDLAALMAWVRRRMQNDKTLDHTIHQDRFGLADIIAADLGLLDGADWALCEQAGWPS